MAPLPTLKTTSQLYPPRIDPALGELTRTIVAFRPGDGSPPELRRALSVEERSKLSARKRELDGWLEPGSPSEMKLAINEMFDGFGGSDPDEESRDRRNENYAFACRERTSWAIVRACLRFRRGEVRAEEVGEKSLSLTWKPSSAQLNVVANRIEEEFIAESRGIEQVLKATVFIPAGRERTDDVVGNVASYLRRRDDERQSDRVEHQLKVDAESENRRAGEFKHADETFRRAGLEPPRWKPGQVPVTLQMYLSNGWTIEEVEGKRTLVAPRKVSA